LFLKGCNQLSLPAVPFSYQLKGRTHQNLEKRIQQHKDDIVRALNSNISAVSFDSALGSEAFENPSHNIFFDKCALISNDLGIKQVAREAIEVRIKINNNISLNRDLGEYALNALYTNLIKNYLKNIKKKQ
jgi:hypothetical protein